MSSDHPINPISQRPHPSPIKYSIREPFFPTRHATVAMATLIKILSVALALCLMKGHETSAATAAVRDAAHFSSANAVFKNRLKDEVASEVIA